jgi:hypothetical protein
MLALRAATQLTYIPCRMALVEAERALEHWATDEDSLEGQGAVIWRTAQVGCFCLALQALAED